MKRPNKDTLVCTLARCNVWKRGVQFCIGPLDLMLLHQKKRYGIEIDDDTVKAMRELSQTGGAAITVEIKPKCDVFIWAPAPIQLGVLVHECVHAATHILEFVGADSCDEARAYLVEFLFNEFSAVTSCVRRQSSLDASSSLATKRSARFSRRGREKPASSS